MRRGLSALSLIFPDEETWKTVEGWVPPAADAGYTFGVSDLLIASLANDIDALIWAFDQDFADMERLKMVRLYADLPSPRRRARR